MFERHKCLCKGFKNKTCHKNNEKIIMNTIKLYFLGYNKQFVNKNKIMKIQTQLNEKVSMHNDITEEYK